MKPLIVANWKMNPQTLERAKPLFDSVKKGIKNIKNVAVVICPPFVYLPYLLTPKPDTLNPKLGAQDCFWEKEGSFTGEVSPLMLKNFGAEYVIIGHSERRRYLKETDEMINKKIKTALGAKLKPIVCIANLTQLKKSLKGIPKKVIVAFEPLSAIGTGRPYSIGRAKTMRNLIKYPFVLYGGSVDSENAADFVKKAGFQGLLVGSASLNAKEFTKIIKNINRN